MYTHKIYKRRKWTTDCFQLKPKQMLVSPLLHPLLVFLFLPKFFKILIFFINLKVSELTEFIPLECALYFIVSNSIKTYLNMLKEIKRIMIVLKSETKKIFSAVPICA